MTEAESRLKQAELDVEKQRSRVREAASKMKHGMAKLSADYELGCDALKAEFEREAVLLKKEEAWVEYAKANLERGFEK